jgi:Fe-Mn family superoxide dismutase
MQYEPKNYDHLLGLQGFSDTLLKNHFTLYQGYVTNTNKLADAMAAMIKDGKQATLEFAELKRRFGWEFNGMRLHELYFGNLSPTKSASMLGSQQTSDIAKGGKAIPESVKKQVVKDFGSYENWEKEMKAICAMRGIGWGVLYYDIGHGRLFNCWINEHDVGHLSTCAPILVIDVFEHAYMTDYGIKRADYLEALWKVLDWSEAERRLKLVGFK